MTRTGNKFSGIKFHSLLLACMSDPYFLLIPGIHYYIRIRVLIYIYDFVLYNLL